MTNYDRWKTQTPDYLEDEPEMTNIDYNLFGLRVPDAFENPLSWQEVRVWLKIKNEQ
jgi:hypothetical protein